MQWKTVLLHIIQLSCYLLIKFVTLQCIMFLQYRVYFEADDDI